MSEKKTSKAVTKKTTVKKVVAKKTASKVSKSIATSKMGKTSNKPGSLRSFIGRKTDDKATGKLLVVMDETSESLAALRFAGVSAKRLSSQVVLLLSIETETQRHWLGVESIIKKEAHQQARAKMRALAGEVIDYTNITPDIIIREGDKYDSLAAVVAEDDEITSIVMGVAAGDDTSKAAPMIEKVLTGHLGRPVIIVPEELSERMLLRIARLA